MTWFLNSVIVIREFSSVLGGRDNTESECLRTPRSGGRFWLPNGGQRIILIIFRSIAAFIPDTRTRTHPPAHDKGKIQDLVKGSSDKCPLKADHPRAAGGMHPSENFKMGSTSNIFLAYPI